MGGEEVERKEGRGGGTPVPAGGVGAVDDDGAALPQGDLRLHDAPLPAPQGVLVDPLPAGPRSLLANPTPPPFLQNLMGRFVEWLDREGPGRPPPAAR